MDSVGTFLKRGLVFSIRLRVTRPNSGIFDGAAVPP